MKHFVYATILALGIASIGWSKSVEPVQFHVPEAQNSFAGTRIGAGLGIGVMYGQAGANLEYRITPQLAATAGIGLDGDGKWLAGGRYYFKPEGSGARGRITVAAADTNTDHPISFSEDTTTKAIFAIGWSWANADNNFRGFDVDLTTEGSVSVGYHF